MKNKKVLLGMSGGVDSSVSALLLKKQGYEVIGATLELFPTSSCGNAATDLEAKKVCDCIGIPHFTYEAKNEFKNYVIQDFMDCYAECKTPNPCIECNKYMKFGFLWEKAKELGCDYIATGHYAKTEYSEEYQKWVLKKSNNPKKDQSYVLWRMPKSLLSQVLFPLADFESKEEIRKIARENHLQVASKPDSEDICFVPDGNYKRFLENYSDIKPKAGNIVNRKGEILGKHTGLYHYTIGQRKGLGISNPVPLFVLGFDKAKNEVIVGEETQLYQKEMIVTKVNLLLVDKLEEMEVYVKTRYSSKVAKAKILQEKETIRVIFEEPQRAITPGQSAVFYKDDIVLRWRKNCEIRKEMARMKKAEFDIQGMTCSSCQAHVEKAVSKLEGTKNVNVNLLSNHMTVQYDDQLLTGNDIIKAVTDAGYGAVLAEQEEKKKAQLEPKKNDKDEMKSMKNRLVISVVFWIPLMYVAMYHMFYKWLGLPIPQLIERLFHGNENALTFGFVQFLLLLPIVYVNRNYFSSGLKKLMKRMPNMDSLIAIGSLAAIGYGIYAILMIGYGLGHSQIELVERFSKDLYLESAGTILTLITLGKYLETKSKRKTGDAIYKLMNLAPKTAVVLRNNKEVEIEVDEILIGDIVLIKPGGSIPVDGVIVEGSSAIDQSSITGESIPVEKSEDDTVISGTINKNGAFKMKATRVGNETTLSQIIKLVEEAGNSKAPIARLADRVSGIFVPCVITIALLAMIFWLLQGQSFEFALSIGIAVLVISCPCALGLATPVAIMVGTGKAAENGILVKSAESLELLHQVNTVVLDKTGTVTMGKPKVIDVITQIEEPKFWQVVGSLEQNSEHPLAEAVLEKAQQNAVQFLKVEEFSSILGRGVKGKIEETFFFGGNIALMQENGIDTKEMEKQTAEFLAQGKTVLYFADAEKIIGAISVADSLKESSFCAIQEMKNRNLEVVMLTGDHHVVAKNIGESLGIDKVVSEVLPQDKEKEVQQLQNQGKKVAFVGDGINDSPALVRADVGLAIGSGTDIAIDSADVVLMKNSLQDVVTAIDLSKAVIR